MLASAWLGWPYVLVPVQVNSRWTAGQPGWPAVSHSYPTTPGIERRSVSTYVIARPDERFETSTGLAVRHTEKDGTAQVEMRPVDGQLTDEAR